MEIFNRRLTSVTELPNLDPLYRYRYRYLGTVGTGTGYGRYVGPVPTYLPTGYLPYRTDTGTEGTGYHPNLQQNITEYAVLLLSMILSARLVPLE